jgi:cytochrome c oxidase assembly protein subunit 15
MKTLALTSLLLVIVLVSLSAYLRLAHSGIGCADWPACYGEIGSSETGRGTAEPAPTRAADAYRKLVDESGRALAWATPLHRAVASVLGLLVVALFFTALRRKRQRLLSALLLALTVYLAVLGMRSGSLHDPAVIMGNLAGGFGMLGLLGWLVFSSGSRGQPPRRVALVTAAAGLVLCAQILLGGLTSANFAATSCQTLPDCHGGWWPGPALAVALDLTRKHEVTTEGQAVGGDERIAIHRAHRLGAVAVLLLAMLAAGMAFTANPRLRPVALVIVLLVAAEFLVGVASVVSGLPIALAVSHNGFAGLLLLALLKLLALSTGRLNELSTKGPVQCP